MFKVGDKVKCNNNMFEEKNLTKEKIYIITGFSNLDGYHEHVFVIDDNNENEVYQTNRFGREDI